MNNTRFTFLVFLVMDPKPSFPGQGSILPPNLIFFPLLRYPLPPLLLVYVTLLDSPVLDFESHNTDPHNNVFPLPFVLFRHNTQLIMFVRDTTPTCHHLLVIFLTVSKIVYGLSNL